MTSIFLARLLPIIAAVIAGMAVGSLWFSPLLFSKEWIRLSGIDVQKGKKRNMAAIMLTSVPIKGRVSAYCRSSAATSPERINTVTNTGKATTKTDRRRLGYGMEFGDDRGVVGRPFVFPGFDIDAAPAAFQRQDGVAQDMIDSQAVIAVEGPRTIIPPAEAFIRLVELPEYVQ